MLKLSLVVPDATVNYIENPNCRYDTTGYNAAGATLTRSLDYARFGIASCRVVTGGTILREGMYYRVNALSGLSGPLTASVYVSGTGIVRARLIDNPTGKEWSSENVTLRADRWVRLSASGVITGSNDVRLYVETNEGLAKARTFYVGGLQMERKAYMTTFCDGDQPGCQWNGLYHGSTSQRAGDSRAGGRWVVIGGPAREEQDLYMTVVGGLGVAPITNNTQSYALDAGGHFQNKKINERVINLTFHAKHKVESAENVISLAALHQLRQLLLDVVKPDKTGGDEDILFEYDDGETPLYFRARYDGGLEGDWDIRNQWVNSFVLRLLAVSPLLEEDQQVVKQLYFQDTLKFNNVLGRLRGTWTNLNSGFDSYLGAADLGPKGQIYMAGLFGVVNNSAGAVEPLRTARVTYWDGVKWVAIAVSLATSNVIEALAVASNGDVYIGGEFTAVNGVAANYIAKYTVSTGVWSALGTGMNAKVYAIEIAPNGDVYAGGAFTTAGGVACAKIARWDGGQWRRLGQYGGLNGDVRSIAITQNGSMVYVGGEFFQENGVSSGATDLNNIAQYNTAVGLFQRMGEGLTTNIAASDRVYAILISPSGLVIAGGHFTLSGTTVLQNIAQWNGGVWQPMGNGLGSGVSGSLGEYVADLALFSNGNLLAVGQFTNTGGREISKAAVWNGSTWLSLDEKFSISDTAILGVCVIDPKTNDLYLGAGSNIGTQTNLLYAGINTVNNTGTVEAFPVFYIQGPGTLRSIENQTIKKAIYFDLIILDGEEVFIDIGRGTITSTVRGTLFYGILPGSDFRSFVLLPGNNVVAAFMTNDVNAKMSVLFTPRHWSADAAQNVEAL